jgi:hypothetical protein
MTSIPRMHITCPSFNLQCHSCWFDRTNDICWTVNISLLNTKKGVLGAFAKLQEATVSFVTAVRSFFSMEQMGSLWTVISAVLNWGVIKVCQEKFFFYCLKIHLKIGPIGCPETSIRNWHSMLRKIPEEGRSHVHRGTSLKSRIRQFKFI